MCRDERDEIDHRDSAREGRQFRESGAEGGPGSDSEAEAHAKPSAGVVVPLARRRARSSPIGTYPNDGPDNDDTGNDDDPGPTAA